ncbi:MAG: hypothetical protein ISP41_14075 [Alphaproteobacteria bacterium]|nr:hypothetical protein [Alphaproteobacteria bacterium]
MKLVTTGDYTLMLSAHQRLFPGAPVPTVKLQSASGRNAKFEALARSLTAMQPGTTLDSLTVANDLGVDWSKNGKRFVTHPRVADTMYALGITYQSKRGRNGTAWFQRAAA